MNYYVTLFGKDILINRVQFPLTLPYSFTIHKAQGRTLSSAIIDLKKAPGTNKNEQFAYVALSRLRSLKDLLILRVFDFEILTQKPDENLLDEI
jgi:ATP-dependent exoDNAse (exonuclease V) alpha subunit